MIGWVKMLPQPGHLDRRVHLGDQLVLGLLPEHQPVGEGLLELRPQGLELLARGLPHERLPLATEPHELFDGGPVGDVDGPVEQLPVEVPDSLPEPVLLGRDDPVRHSREEVGRELAEELTDGLASSLERPRARAQEVGTSIEDALRDEPV